MSQTERIQPKEIAAPEEVSNDTSRPITASPSISGLSVRTKMLSMLEPKLSPLMREALQIKLAYEVQEVARLAAHKEEAKKADERTRGALDGQFFRRRRLSEGSW